MESSGRSKRTADAYASDLKVLLEWHDSRGLHYVGPVILASQFEICVMAWLGHTKSDASPATTRRRMTACREFAQWAGIGPVLGRYRPPPMKPAKPHPLPEGMDGVQAMIDVGKNCVERGLVALCGYQGLRVDEAVNLTVHSYDRDTDSLLIKGKGARWREIPVTDLARPYVLDIYAEARLEQYERLVPMSNSWARARITQLGKEAGLKRTVSSHDLRATFATELYRKSKDLMVVKQFLGHARTDTTEVYTLVKLEEMRAGALKLLEV